MSNIGFKNSSLLVNANLVGLRQRTGVLARNYAGGNYALRSDWGCTDGLRAVLGKYFAVSATTTGQDFVNFASDKLSSPSVRNQVKDIPLILTEIPSTNDNIGPKSARFLIELDNTAWNKLNFTRPGYTGNTVDFLRQNIDEEGVEEGDPNWRWYLKRGIPQTAAPSYGTKWLFPMPPVINTQGTFFDHTTLYYTPSSNKAIRAESGTNIKVEPVYNYYADTTPPYEQISQVASEPMLTNFYCLESEMRNTSPTLNSMDYFAQITLDNALQTVNIDNDAQADPWFQQVEGQEGTMTESKTVQLYTLYSKGLNILSTANPGLADLKGVFNTKYKNIVILNSDLGAMSDLAARDDETSGLKNLPFYNKITIGYDTEGVGDYSEISDAMGGSWLGELRTDLNNEISGEHGIGGAGSQLIDIMQLYIIQNIEGFGTAGTSQTFKKRSVEKLSAEDPTNLTTSVTSRNIPFVFNMNDFLNDILFREMTDKGYAPTRIERIIERINTNETADDNFILIRNYNQNVVEMDNEAIRAFLLLEEDGRINYPTRTIQQIVLQNKLAANETLLYKIDKRVITSDGTASDPVQTFYIGRSFEGRAINYIDSQVKYGVRYRYDISEIKIVFGSKYSYANLSLHYTNDVGRQNGRAVGNALGFYRPVRSDILLDDIVEQHVKEYVPVDEDVPFTAVGIESTNSSPTQTGYYIFKPTNRGEIDAIAFSNLFDTGTDFVARRGPSADQGKLAKINIQVKEGFGLGGNENGGAIGATLNLPIAVAAPAPPPTGNRRPRLQNTRIRAPIPGTGASAQFGLRNRRPRAGVRAPRPGTTRGPRIGTRINRPGGVTPPLTPNFLQNLFGIP